MSFRPEMQIRAHYTAESVIRPECVIMSAVVWELIVRSSGSSTGAGQSIVRVEEQCGCCEYVHCGRAHVPIGSALTHAAVHCVLVGPFVVLLHRVLSSIASSPIGHLSIRLSVRVLYLYSGLPLSPHSSIVHTQSTCDNLEASL